MKGPFSVWDSAVRDRLSFENDGKRMQVFARACATFAFSRRKEEFRNVAPTIDFKSLEWASDFLWENSTPSPNQIRHYFYLVTSIELHDTLPSFCRWFRMYSAFSAAIAAHGHCEAFGVIDHSVMAIEAALHAYLIGIHPAYEHPGDGSLVAAR